MFSQSSLGSRAAARRRLPHAELEIDVEEAAGLRAVIVRGELDVSTAPELDAALDTAPAQPLDLFVDLSALEFMDCAGAHRLAAAGSHQRARGRQFAIACAPTGEVARLFETLAASGLELPVFPSQADALRAALAPPALARALSHDAGAINPSR